MFSCPKEHLTSLEEFYTLPVPVGMQLQAALERASLSSLFLSLPLLLSRNIFWACAVCQAPGYLHEVFSWRWCVFSVSHAACGPDMLGSVQCVQWNALTQMLRICNSWYWGLSLTLRLYSEKELTQQYFRSCVRSWSCAKPWGRGPDSNATNCMASGFAIWLLKVFISWMKSLDTVITKSLSGPKTLWECKTW